MINRRLRREIKSGQSLKTAGPPLLQRKCACGAASGLNTCHECSGKGDSQLAQAHESSFGTSTHALDNVQRSTNSGHHFGQLAIYPAHNVTTDAIFINGPDKDAPKTGAPKTPPPPKTSPPKQNPPAQPSCPTDIQVLAVDQLNDPDFGKPDGFMTGVGALALMEVSGPGRKEWNGVKIKESLKRIDNTCGARAKDVCSNKSGDPEDFEVGAARKIFGKTDQPAFMNAFQDQHIFALKKVSVLHEKDLPDCQVNCEQTYSCGGKQIGPTFIITYNATKDTIKKTYDVTRIKVDKKAKTSKP